MLIDTLTPFDGKGDDRRCSVVYLVHSENDDLFLFCAFVITWYKWFFS